jgi:DNA polymerase-3 subunit gamma/tau
VEPGPTYDAQTAPPEPSQGYSAPPAYPAETRHEDTARAPEQEFREPEFSEPESRAPEPRAPESRAPESREPEFREPEFREPEFRAPEPRTETPVETRFEPPRDTWSPPPEEPSRRDEFREPVEPAGESPADGPDDRPRN